MKSVDIYTDGSCLKNPGYGGWGAVLIYDGHRKELSGGEKDTTNNRMELTAAIKALEALKMPCKVTLTSDSSYLVNAFNNGWIYGWEKKNWVKSGKPVPNTDLWKSLLVLTRTHEVTFQWIRGHNGHPENELCDRLAVEQSTKLKFVEE